MANKATLEIITNEKGNTKTKKIKYSTRDQETIQVYTSVDKGEKQLLGEVTYSPSDVEQPEDKAPEVFAGEDAIVIEGDKVTLDGTAHDDGQITRAEWFGPDGITITPDPQDITKATFTAPTIPENFNVQSLIFFFEAEDDKANITRDSVIITVTKDGTIPPIEPPKPPVDPLVLYDSLIDSNLHNGIVRTVKQEGDISPNGKGVECRASGNPRIVVNADGTFSLVCDTGHGRFYLHITNYNVIFEITAMWMNTVAGQDISLKDRSFHNENVDDPNRNNNDFGGYGYSNDRTTWSAKREPFHNTHDQAKSGSLPDKLETGKPFTIRFAVFDEGTGVKQWAEVNDKKVMEKIDDNPEPYMINRESDNRSTIWVRQNIDEKTGELRILRMRVLKKV